MTKLGSMITRFAGMDFRKMPKLKYGKVVKEMPPIPQHPGGINSITGERYGPGNGF